MNAPHLRNVTIVTTVMLLFLSFDAAQRLYAAETLRVGIVPFTIHSSEKVEYLQEVISTRLGEELDTNDHITVIKIPASDTVAAAGRSMGTDELTSLAQSLGADYLIYGSLTMIEDELSIDARAFTLLPEESTFRSFVVGTDFDRLITRIETRLADHLLTVATRVAIPDRPVVVEEVLEPATEMEVVEEVVAVAELPADDRDMKPETAGDPAETAQAPVTPPPPAKPEPAVEASAPTPEPAAATETPKPEEEGEENPESVTKSLNQLPFSITSSRMVADNAKRTVTFFGDVKASSEELLVFSDEMTVIYTKERQIESIKARSNVKISQKDITASCQMANFLHGEQKIVLTGKPKVWQGNNMVTGEMITILLKQDKIVVDGEGKERVQVTLYPEKKED